jgi:hypothetical protein
MESTLEPAGVRINLRIEEGAVRTGMPSFVSSYGDRPRAYLGVQLPS